MAFHRPQPFINDAQTTMGMLQKRNRVFKKFIKNQLPAHREAPGVKSTLASPFEMKWPKVSRDIQQMISEKIKTSLASMKADATGGGRKKKEKEKVLEETGDDFTDTLRREEKKSKETKRNEIRTSMVFGINEATRRLEKDELSCLVVCSSTTSICPTNHLQILSATRQCPAMCIRDFSLNVGRSLGMNSLLVLGIKKSPPARSRPEWIDNLVKVIVENSTAVHISWSELTDVEDHEQDEPTLPIKSENEPEICAKNKLEKALEDAKSGIAETKREPIDVNSFYIKKSESDWLADDKKIVPVIRGSKSIVAQNFIKVEADTKPEERERRKRVVELAQNSFGVEAEEPERKKRAVDIGYLPPHVIRVKRDENKKKKRKEKNKKKKKS